MGHNVSDGDTRQHSLMEAIPALLWTARPDGYVDYCNQSWLDFTGLSQAQAQGDGWMQALHPADVTQARQVWTQACQQGQLYEVEHRLRRQDGQYCWFLTRARPVRDASGQIVQWYGINMDITERRQAVKAQQSSEARYRSLFEQNPDGVVILDPESTRFIEFNNQACQQLGYTRAEFSQLRLPDIETNETLEDSLAHIQRVLHNGRDDFETRHRTRQGEIRNVLVTAHTVEAGGGQSVYHCIWRDITERKHAEERFRTMFETMTQGAIYYDSALQILSANPAAEQILGLTHEQLVGGPLIDQEWPWIGEDGAALPGEMYPARRALDSGQPVTDTIIGVFNPALKQHVWLKVNAIPLFKPGENSPYQVYTIFDDISAYKRNDDILLARLRLIQNAGTYSLKELVLATLDEAMRLASSPIGFFHFLDPDETMFTLQAWSSRMSKDDGTVIEEDAHFLLADTGAWADAVRQRRPVIHNRYSGQEDVRGLPVMTFSLVRDLIVPVMRNNRVVAIMSVGNKASEYGAADIESVAALADLSWDIVQRRRMDEALRASEQEYHRLINALPVGVAILQQGHIAWVNRTAARLLGADHPQQLAGAAITDHIDGQWQQWIDEHEQVPAGQEQEATPIEGRLLRLDGSAFDAEVTVITVSYLGKPSMLGLFNDITERKRASDQLKQALAEKETLLRELYHRTKNNMSVIISLLDLQANYNEDTHLQAAFAVARERIHSMSLVHQKLYEASDLSRLNLKEYLHDLALYLLQCYSVSSRQITFTTEMEDIFVLIDTAIPCGLILNELITNALKHAFPAGRQGHLQLALRRIGDDLIQLEVSDDGTGLPPGFNPDQDGHLGLQLVNSLAENQLRARVSFLGEAGVTCRLEFKDNLYARRV